MIARSTAAHRRTTLQCVPLDMTMTACQQGCARGGPLGRLLEKCGAQRACHLAPPIRSVNLLSFVDTQTRPTALGNRGPAWRSSRAGLPQNACNCFCSPCTSVWCVAGPCTCTLGSPKHLLVLLSPWGNTHAPCYDSTACLNCFSLCTTNLLQLLRHAHSSCVCLVERSLVLSTVIHNAV